MPAIYRMELVVSDREIDGQGHVNNLEYLRWMQDAAVAHSTAQGWDSERYRQLGAGWVVRSHKIEYLSPAFEGQRITVLTWVSNFRKIQSLRRYKIVREDDDAILALAETNWAFIGIEHHVPRRVPQELAESFHVIPENEEP